MPQLLHVSLLTLTRISLLIPISPYNAPPGQKVLHHHLGDTNTSNVKITAIRISIPASDVPNIHAWNMRLITAGGYIRANIGIATIAAKIRPTSKNRYLFLYENFILAGGTSRNFKILRSWFPISKSTNL